MLKVFKKIKNFIFETKLQKVEIIKIFEKDKNKFKRFNKFQKSLKNSKQ